MAENSVETNSEPVERFSEFPPIKLPDGELVQPADNSNVKVEFEKRDVSIGKARYRGRIPISPNLAYEPRKRQRSRIIPHANVEVTFLDSTGKPVRMTERFCRGWTISPLRKDATVDNLRQWRIQSLHHTSFIPFSPMPISKREQLPLSFWETPSAEDAPGFDTPEGDVFGTLQEFIVGNPKVGGAYYQIYTLSDRNQTRVFSTNALTFTPDGYRKLKQQLKDPAYKKRYLHKLYFMPTVANDEITTKVRFIPQIAPSKPQ
jgi:hypothetical protein